MEPKKFVCRVYGVTPTNESLTLIPSQTENLKVKDWKSLTFSIEEAKSRKRAAFIEFELDGARFNIAPPYLLTSGENNLLASNFFKTFRQSPFRLLLFSSLSFLEKNGFHNFVADDGLRDSGVAHKKQVRQRIFSHVKKNGKYVSSVHQMGEFPRVSVSELGKILDANKVVPVDLLPPESILRKERAKSFADLEFKKLGRAKYKSMRKSRIKLK